MKRHIAFLALALAVAGCADITMTTACPTSSTGVSFALAGSTVGNTALSMLGTMAQGGMMAAVKGEKDTAPAPTSATMTYRYAPLFGADSGSLSCIQSPQTTTVVTSPPATIVR